MNQHTPLIIGLFGFGVVGEGIYNVLKQTPTLNSHIKKICIKNPQKQRNAPRSLFNTEASVLLDDPDINVIVELIDNAEDAYHIVKRALKNKKHVISANKKLIAQHYTELITLSQAQGVSFLYEAAVCGSIPVIRNLEEYYDNDWLYGFAGIINGSTNYILTQMRKEKLSYERALQQAQSEGFAESDPNLDVRGLDAANKLSILSAHIYGKHWAPSSIAVKGIQSLQLSDFEFAQEKGFDIKLVAQNVAQSSFVTPFIFPTFVGASSRFFHLDNEYNGVLFHSLLSDEQFFYGKGAGRYPTSSAVLSDLSALRYGYKYEYRKASQQNNFELSYQLSGRFFLSMSPGACIDEQLFETIEERYQSTERNYLIGRICLERIIDSGLLERDDVSIILFDHSLRSGTEPAMQAKMLALA